MTRCHPVGPVALGLAQGRAVVLVLDTPPPRARAWPWKRWVLCVALFAGGCAGGGWL